jgi:hypothetical protein
VDEEVSEFSKEQKLQNPYRGVIISVHKPSDIKEDASKSKSMAYTNPSPMGNAFIMGQFVATNIMKLMLGEETLSPERDLLECPPMDPMMALSIGSNALVYQEALGVLSSEELKETVIGRDMGIDGE